MIRLPVLFFFLFLLTGCSSTSGIRYDLTEKDSGSTLRPETGDVIRIVLKSNPSTGYFWQEDGVPDSDVIRQVSETIQGEKTELKTGVPGVQTMLYKVVGSGETGIRLSYRRPWEKNAPQDSFQIRVIVESPVGFIDFLDNSRVPTKRVGSKGQVEPLYEE